MKSLLSPCSAIMVLLLCPQAYSGEISRNVFASQVLGRDYPYNIYLPDGYDDATKRYPVVYLLHGSIGSEASWVKYGDIQATADRLIENELIPPMMIVMPGHNESWWADGNDERAESALLHDVMSHVASHFRALETREGRAVAGLSAGGFGAINMALKHPERFAAAAALSPAIYTPLPPAGSTAYQHSVFLQQNGEFEANTWHALNWPAHLDDYRAQKLRVPMYINSGDHDRFDIAYHAAYFYQQMRAVQPEHIELRIVDGDHDWQLWADTIDEALQFLAQHLSPPLP